MEIKIGSKLKNNDPRKNGEIVTVEGIVTNNPGVEPRSAVYRTSKRTVQINFSRIFLDGKARSQGYNLLPDGA